MKAIMIRDKPKWVAKILNGEKIIEIRKTYPKQLRGDTPFKPEPIDVYIYCTKSNYFGYISKRYIGKVVAKFTLNKVEEIKTCERHSPELLKQSCLNANEFYDYLTKGKNFLGQILGYAWHISNLVIFDKPKELSEFHRKGYEERLKREIKYSGDIAGIVSDTVSYWYQIKKAPQSWCYVEVEE